MTPSRRAAARRRRAGGGGAAGVGRRDALDRGAGVARGNAASGAGGRVVLPEQVEHPGRTGGAPFEVRGWGPIVAPERRRTELREALATGRQRGRGARRRERCYFW